MGAFEGNVVASSANIYTSNGVIADALRTVEINTELRFDHGLAGVNGRVQMISGGYFKNTSVANPLNYFEFNHNTNIFTVQTTTATVSGFKATRIGTLGNPTADVELFAGSNGTAYLNVGPTTSTFYFLNNGGVNGAIYTSSGAWGIGGFPEHTTSLTLTGKGGTAATNSQKWKNLSGTEYARMIDSGGLAIGINTLTGGFANAERLRVDATISTDYTNTVVFDQIYSNLANNGNTVSTFTTRLYKGNSFNTGEMKANFTQVRNDGTGNMTYMYGTESMVWNLGAATINSAFAYSARCQIRDGIVTNWGGLDVSYQENNAPAVVGNMIGVLVRTPTNVSGIAVSNTFGVLLQPNTLATTNNYGFVSSGQMTNGFGTLTPSLNTIADFSSTTKAPLKLGGGMTAAQASALTAEDSMIVYVTDTNGTFTSLGFWGRENGVWIKL